MSAVERLQAAVARLEALKADSTPGPWRLDGPEYHWYGEGGSSAYVNTSLISAGHEREGVVTPIPPAGVNRWSGLHQWVPTADANLELIVTLHRTIDAQIAILNAAVFNAQQTPNGATHATVAAAIRLADAVLGGAE